MGDSVNTNGNLDPGVSIRNGPVGDGDVEMEDAADGANGRGAGKRKSRASTERKSYAEPESSEEEDKPLVRFAFHHQLPRLPHVPLFESYQWFQRLTIPTEQASSHI